MTAACTPGESAIGTGSVLGTDHFCQRGGGGCSSFAADFFPLIGDGKLPQRPYTGTRRRAHTHRAPHPPPADSSQCAQHSATACTTYKRLRRTAEACCALGHHADDHIARRPQLQLCPLHGLPPCPRCTLKQSGVRHCCQRGHHKVCTPGPVRRKRPLTQSQLPNKRPRPQGSAHISTGLLRSPHQPPTPPAPKRRGPKSPPPSVPASPISTGAGGDRGRGCRTPAFRDEARESKHSGYLASKLQRF